MFAACRWPTARAFNVLMIAAWVACMPITVSAAQGPPQQVIVKWRDELPAGKRTAITAQVLRAAGAQHRISLQYLRSTAVGGAIYQPSRSLSRTEMDTLIRTLSADPNVEYAEEDSMMRPMPR